MDMERQSMDLELDTVNGSAEAPPPLFKEANLPITLKFQDVVYKVKLNKGSQLCPKGMKSDEKEILKGVSGLVLPGEMLAMLGPSGSGKTTLLTALGGKLGGRLSGSITYNGKAFSNAIKRNTGFVTQDDVLYPHLTVTETLVFTALLRLPNSFTREEKIRQAESVVAQLGLLRCKNSIIGGPLLRGVSGGERKRVSIGQEMLINPSLLFLDEPTSGLDSTTAQRIVSTLWDLSKGGRTIVMTIHQPSSRLFYMFDKVLLLSEGNPLYFGEGARAMDYFSSVGYAPSLAMNPSDFLLDLANGLTPNGDSGEDPVMVKQTLAFAYQSNIDHTLKAEIRATEDNPRDAITDKQLGRWPTNWWQQFTVLMRRGIKERRHEFFSTMKIVQVFFVSFLSGLLWWQSDSSHIQDQIGLLFFASGFWGFFPLFQAIFIFPQERMMLAKERSSGMYRLSSYFMSMIVSDLPMELLLPTCFVTITYWMAGLKHSAAKYFQTLFVFLYSVLVSQGLGLAIGSLVMDLKKATTFGSVIMLTFVLAGGFYVQHVPGFISWIKYVSISNYSYKLLLGSQYEASDTYVCDTHGKLCLVGDFPQIKMIGLDGQGVAAVALGVMLLGYRLIAYLGLMRVGVTK
ncbi:hypothetical protein K2173_007748 [Erythroxylum novogranatense]|uniref:ABC transporter domain-containing protein n=1 Tax=Erythroxylum novogranatense TaxID=1862640 RepID=A0AAV8TCY1_9ROSI|nr:hypothetical protein K2173_007748 [Erythroxylum novogranatense]